MQEPVTIVDRDVLKALSVDTRMDILKILSEGGRTPSFIGKKLNKTDATIVEHLNALVKAGLVKKVEQPGKKWVFYTLTDRGYGIASSKSRRLIIILSSSLLGLFLGSFGVLSTLYSYTAGALSGGAIPTAMEKIPEAAKPLTDTAVAPIATQQTIIQIFLTYGSAALVVLSLVGLTYFVYQKLKFKGV